MRIAAQTTDLLADPAEANYDLAALCDADLLEAWSRDRYSPALAALVQRYSVMVLSVCRRRCRSDADAEDAFQTTFLYLARNSQKIRKPERLPGWLHRVAQRAAVATWKSARRETEPMVEPPANPDDPLDRLTQRHEAIVLDEELADLPEHYRSALVMHICEGRPLQHLAEHFGTTIGSIRGRLQRGKQLLGRRLRHRGVVPVLAIAAANAWTAPAASAADASKLLIDATAGGQLPDPPLEPALLDSLLAQGVRLMPTIYTTAAVLGGVTLLAMLVTAGPPPQGAGDDKIGTIAVGPAVVGQFGGPVAANIDASGTGNAATTPTGEGDPNAVGGQAVPAGTGGFGGFGNQTAPLVWEDHTVLPELSSRIAMVTSALLDVAAEVTVTARITDLADALNEVLEVPVLLDERGIRFAEVDLANTGVTVDSQELPLRTALRKALQPLGLRAVVEEEGLVITADPAALVHHGIGTMRWINVDNDAADQISRKLQDEISFEFVELPLEEAMGSIREQHDLPLTADRRALEEIGMSLDVPVSLVVEGIQVGNALTMLLGDLDLVTTLQGESLVITTAEAAEQRPLHRIYWLESTGIAKDDYESIMSLITSTIKPDTWDQLGGPSTMAPLKSIRPALLISTTYDVHQSIENLFETLREAHFGADPVLERVQVPAKPGQLGGGQFGGGGMGGGGFF